jgi:release factor glutamine methyltransferase
VTVREASAAGTARLAEAGVDVPALDASLLLSHVLGTDRAALYARGPDPVPSEAEAAYADLIVRRAAGTCVAYLVGYKEFRDLLFAVSPAVLVPRPDTETLVEAALSWIDDRLSAGSGRPLRVLDACTGSGCVAVSLKAERPALSVSACDVSEAALEVARNNARTLLGDPAEGGRVAAGEAPVSFYLSDLLSGVPGSFDLIVSNPPYVPAAEIDRLSAEVRGEPRLALDGGEDGLDLVRRLIAEARDRLNPGGRLLVEAGWDQSPEICRLLSAAGFGRIESYRDLGGHERVTGGTLP